MWLDFHKNKVDNKFISKKSNNLYLLVTITR